MEATYSSVPKIENTVTELIIISASTLLIGAIIWLVNEEIKKEKNENSHIHES